MNSTLLPEGRLNTLRCQLLSKLSISVWTSVFVTMVTIVICANIQTFTKLIWAFHRRCFETKALIFTVME